MKFANASEQLNSSKAGCTLPNQTAKMLFFSVEHLYVTFVQNLRDVLHTPLWVSTTVLLMVEAFIVYFHMP